MKSILYTFVILAALSLSPVFATSFLPVGENCPAKEGKAKDGESCEKGEKAEGESCEKGEEAKKDESAKH